MSSSRAQPVTEGPRQTPGKAPLGKAATRLACLAYACHLLVPLFLLADVLLTDYRTPFEQLVLVLSASWFVVGLIPLVLPVRQRAALAVAKPVLAFFAGLLALTSAEIVIGFMVPEGPKPMLYRPGMTVQTFKDPSVSPGMSGVSTYTVNNVGLRGPDLPLDAPAHRIVTLGGSTTESTDLDDGDEWPRLLMQYLNDATGRGTFVWVGNAGVAAHTTVHHLGFMRSLPLVANSQVLVFLIGVNDLVQTLAHRGEPTDLILEESSRRAQRGFSYPRFTRPYFKRLELYGLARSVVFNLGDRLRGEPRFNDTFFVERRRRRAAAAAAALPPLSTGLEEYARRIERIAAECRNNGQRCIFLTQPALWRHDLSEYERGLLWFGWVGPEGEHGFVSVDDLSRAMALYNQRLLDECERSGLECYDLAAAIPKDTTAFFDDCHFNVSGSRLVAAFLGDQLLKRRELLMSVDKRHVGAGR